MQAKEKLPPSSVAGFRVRPLVPSDGHGVGLLVRDILREIGTRPTMTVEDTERLFRTDWLEKGGGLALVRDSELAGCCWANPSHWNGEDYVLTGVFLGTGFRDPATARLLAEPMLKMIEDVGARHAIPRAVVHFRSIDTAHPRVVATIGFRQHPVSMLGFRHDLRVIPLRPAPPDVTLRASRLPDDKPLLLVLSSRAFDDPKVQGQPVKESFIDFECGKPTFAAEQLVFAECAGETVGYVLITRTAGTEERCYDIAEIGVVPEMRGRGIGSALLCRALNWVKGQNAECALVAAFSTNRATTAYWRMGFRPDPLRTYYFYTRPLGPEPLDRAGAGR